MRTITYYTWNALGQMATAEPADNQLVTLTYNAAGQRVQKDSGGTVTNFLYDHQTLLQESDEADDPTKSYTAADDEYGDLLATFDDTDEGGHTEFYHQFDGGWHCQVPSGATAVSDGRAVAASVTVPARMVNLSVRGHNSTAV